MSMGERMYVYVMLIFFGQSECVERIGLKSWWRVCWLRYPWQHSTKWMGKEYNFKQNKQLQVPCTVYIYISIYLLKVLHTCKKIYIYIFYIFLYLYIYIFIYIYMYQKPIRPSVTNVTPDFSSFGYLDRRSHDSFCFPLCCRHWSCEETDWLVGLYWEFYKNYQVIEENEML